MNFMPEKVSDNSFFMKSGVLENSDIFPQEEAT